MKKTQTAAELISATKTGLPMPDAKTIAELKKILAHNDASGHLQRVSCDKTIAFLRARGWMGTARPALNSLCAKLGRTSFGTP